ncbi:3-keto-5-aminohexanoate cleavage protein [Vagococcus sp. BWB3-3]|uniref:3-keto-5-aminohexanoate cleavage protein n=1 Tax=Vagococcus allomyrinae TaxID=2794353 RepID=A0A940SUQ5_9ENTE|nr:3-keto-5-aminohexanoate cleavage protein [Vagococcus allomyrinae]MBP1040286.1 3-keto-5-aminohexanoate cleavage protein [Vagococcus allomyrinae]
MRKIIIALAPVQSGKAIDYAMLSEDIVDAIKCGASICHLHSRNINGQLSKDCTDMMACFERVLQEENVIIQASTGGISDMTIVERCQPLNYEIVESCSLNAGSTNLGEAVYVNSFQDIRYVSQMAYEKEIYPEIEVFDIGMIQALEKISEELPFKTPKLYNLVFGHPGGMQATIENLIAFRSFVPKDSLWGVTHYGRTNWDFLTAAIILGATDVRIGFEDSDYLNENMVATKNAELVKKLSDIIFSIGYTVATVTEARQLLKMNTSR